MQTGKASIAAEYLVRSVITGEHHFAVEDYLVIEVRFQPVKGERIRLAHEHFTLRLNGRKHGILPQSPQMVAAALKYADWERRPTMTAAGSVGDAGVILGRPPVTERFPGDPRPRQQRLPGPVPRAPEMEDRSGVDKAPRQKPEEVVVAAALPEEETSHEVRGFLYFPYQGKPKSIKKLELLYSGPAGEAAIPLL